jgi:hypothetical protein
VDDQLTRQDDAILRALAGANFGPGSSVVLPSGKTIRGDEAQALSSAYLPDAVPTGPATSAYLQGGGDPGNERVMALLASADRSRAQRQAVKTEIKAAVRRRWWQFWRRTS